MPLSFPGKLGLQSLIDQFNTIDISGGSPAQASEDEEKSRRNSSRTKYKWRVRETQGFDHKVETPYRLLAS